MSITNPTIDAGALSETIVRDLLADGLQAFADDGTTSLTDPKAGDRDSGDAPFVVTSFPTGQTVYYPHVVVSEEDVAVEPIDRRHDVWDGTFTAGFQIEANTDTEKFRIKDGVRAYVVSNYADDTFQNAGFADVSIDGSEAVTWDENSQTTGLQITISGLVHVV